MLAIERRHGVMIIDCDGPVKRDQEQALLSAMERIHYSTDNQRIEVSVDGRQRVTKEVE